MPMQADYEIEIELLGVFTGFQKLRKYVFAKEEQWKRMSTS